ncbi:DUF4062 domain-containing protein [Luteimonas terricola]|uniref:DUF4062 domain-containing protein n=1 Tax=Luteimonas terricola TaxID=645597 RepID=A0ABQ2EML0_9GAMM|nr:DUF4062 domain-containing protein [Luteimonas terricola]GGK16721.1 hypothetical protein GCM10011394_27420 [Luteimonas terricola]
MKVFVSSLITGMEAERAAARHAIHVMRSEAVMAEEFGARASSPQVACLQGLRDADAVVLILGDRYGAKQESGVSATHEEFLEARGRKPILTFVRTQDPEPDQTAFIREIGEWAGGGLYQTFTTPENLGDHVIRALRDLELARAGTPLDPAALVRRAVDIMPEQTRDQSEMQLHLTLAPGPQAALLRPAQIEAHQLADDLAQRAYFGQPPILDRRIGIDHRLDDQALVLFQGDRYHHKAEIRLWGTGCARLVLPIGRSTDMGFAALIEEEVAERIEAGLAFFAWLLARIDPTERQSHVALAARIAGRDAMAWRTRAEQDVSPRSGSITVWGREGEREAPVQLTPAYMARQALAMDARTVAEDLLVLLRRRWKDDP